ncbi:ADP compounds hydrolase NudE [Thalassotalea eurytherma]|uniref:ADP compounds hydrolase NudE n=1 Tax=Thalassotalea eurytherma TaxID=1144278 RepID=A0ABQ6H3P7_9GAMM|nr:ADP compounds hydrolase NudE [Thalassotalea eurytherma]GLX82796.1 ADP compounds hydrolase NudE [Thalassotalea eurytherma]
MTKTKTLPEITQAQEISESRFFAIEELALTFSNGEKRLYERMKGGGRGAVMVVPFKDQDTLLLVREYCAGTHSYELGFPKGLIDPGEVAEQSANRELKEEIGFGARHLEHLHQVMLAPAFFNAKMEIFIAQDLYPESLEGDEPEPLELVEWPVKDYARLLAQPDFNEARSIAALMLVIDRLRGAYE